MSNQDLFSTVGDDRPIIFGQNFVVLKSVADSKHDKMVQMDFVGLGSGSDLKCDAACQVGSDNKLPGCIQILTKISGPINALRWPF